MTTAQSVTGAKGIPVGYAALVITYIAVAGAVVWILRRLARAPLNLPGADAHTRPDRGAGLMFLKDLPLVFVLAGLVLYTVLAGADFGGRGCGRLLAGGGERGERVRGPRAPLDGPGMGGQTTCGSSSSSRWRGRPTPTFIGSVASTLAAPFFIAALGIILRGASYALRSGASTSRESRMVDSAFAVGSLITPFALGAMAGAIAAERVPVGNAAGGLFSSWLSPVPILIGLLAVAFSAYLAAVYLAADAVRHGDAELEEAYRVRALGAGTLAGLLAVVGLIVLHADAHSLYTELLHGAALAVLIVSLLAGAAALWPRGHATVRAGPLRGRARRGRRRRRMGLCALIRCSCRA